MINLALLERPNLSNRQAVVLDYVRAYYRNHGIPATIREIQDACGIASSSNVSYVLRRLADKGLLLRVTRPGYEATYFIPVMPDGSCPLCGCGGQHG